MEVLGGQGGRLPTQLFGNLRNEIRVGTNGLEKSTKFQNLVFLMVKNLSFTHQVFQDFSAPEGKFSKNFGAVAHLPPLL